MKHYVFEVKTFITVKANSEEAARNKLDFVLGDERHDIPQLVNVLDRDPRNHAVFPDLSDTGIDNRRLELESECDERNRWPHD